ncbi:hypothetical protein H2200_007602 [Cladophialophora chaetospira]|uniref:Ima1 N-terminal domain-containing protein n=1 Tax=Cladophialophora chaetospira TaxID=386627 RepID=A0AA38X651_9EURO|nr:hypothetical protein H2200_007602 [Cladophialophora chaetospira]
MVTLRQRLDCHYCGRRSKQTPGKKPGGRFQCEHCLAVNFFDENGEIADVPIEEAAPAERFAQPARPDPLADESSVQDSIFCSTCLKNQQIYNHNLSQYLPDPDHPDYDRLEADLPEYKEKLEQRYPQCCARCEPRVRARMEQATYDARSDHLRRVLEKSRQRRIASRWGWRSLLVNAAGLGYSVSVATQVLWHLYGSQVSQTNFVETIRPNERFQQRAFQFQCLNAAEPLVGLSLVLGLLCIWWNPQWQHKLSNSEGRLVGLHKYYLAQFILLGLRFSAWIVVFHLPTSLRTMAMLHACFAVVITVCAGWSVLSIVQIRMTPAVNWLQDPAPLLTAKQFVPPSRHEPEETRRPQDRPFSVNSLAQSNRPTYQAWNPPTPPLDAAETMDWTPSQPSFVPEPKQIQYTALDPNPFHGTLPALNARGVLKNNQNQKQAGREAIGLPPGFFDKTTNTALPPRQITGPGEAMAEPTFFGHKRESDTGLEDIFDSVFSLRDRSSGQEPHIAARHTQPVQDYLQQKPTFEVPDARKGISLLALFSGISMFSVLFGLAAWIFEAAVTAKTSQLGYYIVLCSTSIPIGHIIIDLYRLGARPTRLLVYMVEGSALIGMALLRAPFGDLFRDLWDKLAIAAVALLLPQSYLALNRCYSANQLQYFEPQQNSAQYRPVPEHEPRRAVRQPTMAETSRAIMPGLIRQDSDESVGTQYTRATTRDPWDSPKAHDERFDYFDTFKPQSIGRNTARSNNTATQRRNKWSSSSNPVGARHEQGRERFGLDGLGLGADSGVSRNENTGITSMFGRGLNLSSPRQRDGLGPRRRF